ncbi:MAG: GAF domain-containing protein [Chloroflexota bacterium]
MTVGVMVITDIPESGERLIEEVLQPAGFDVSLIGRDPPLGSVVVVDINQVSNQPFDGLTRLRAAGVPFPAIVLSPHLPVKHLRSMFQLGVEDFIPKPFSPSDLVASIAEVHRNILQRGGTRPLRSQVQSLHENVAQRGIELAILASVGREVAALTDLDSILKRIVEAGVHLTQAEEGGLYLISHGTKQLVLRAARMPGSQTAQVTYLPSKDGLLAQVMQTGKPLNRRSPHRGDPLKVKTGYLVQATLAVPIRVRTNNIGLVAMYNRQRDRAFSEWHRELLQALADWAAVAIQQARLVEELERRLTRATGELRKLKSGKTGALRTAVVVPPPGLREGLISLANEVEAWLGDAFGAIAEDGKQSLRRMRQRLVTLQQLVSTATLFSSDSETQSLPKVVRDVITSFGSIADARGLHLRSNLSGDFPPISVNHLRLRQLLESLLTNTLHRSQGQGEVLFTGFQFQVLEGQPRTALLLPDKLKLPDGQWVALTISDTGRALLATESKAFDVDAGEMPRHSGPGISLAEARLLARSLGGELWYERNLDTNLFTLALPLD